MKKQSTKYTISNIVYKNKSHKDISVDTDRSLMETAGIVHIHLMNRTYSSTSAESVVKSNLSGSNYQGYLILDNESNVIGDFYIFNS